MPNVRCMAIFQHVNNLPEDRFVNTFHFGDNTSGPPTASDISNIQGDVIAFYNDIPAGGTSSIAEHLSPRIKRTALSAELRLYDLEQVEPRIPIIIPWTLDPSAVATSMPSEVALCLSYFSEQNLPTRRGRLYIGPFNLNADDATTDVDNRPTALLRNTMALAGAALRDSPSTLPWCVYGKVLLAQVMKPITDGWVDDAWDTQRRRGVAPTVRTEW